MLKFSVLLLFLILSVSASKRPKCLKGQYHKSRATPEADMQECTIYDKSSCCHANFTKELAQSPVIKVYNTYWNRCGNLSESCESYMKKIDCFYMCSPLAVHWENRNYSAAIEHVPICQKFCDGWYDACKNDLTCVNNWLTDWEIDEKGENHCKNECIPYSQMYSNGTDLCESSWGNSLKVSESTCRCLNLNENDVNFFKYIRHDSSSSSSSSDSSSEERACRRKMIKLEQLKEAEEEGLEEDLEKDQSLDTEDTDVEPEDTVEPELAPHEEVETAEPTPSPSLQAKAESDAMQLGKSSGNSEESSNKLAA